MKHVNKIAIAALAACMMAPNANAVSSWLDSPFQNHSLVKSAINFVSQNKKTIGATTGAITFGTGLAAGITKLVKKHKAAKITTEKAKATAIEKAKAIAAKKAKATAIEKAKAIAAKKAKANAGYTSKAINLGKQAWDFAKNSKMGNFVGNHKMGAGITAGTVGIGAVGAAIYYRKSIFNGIKAAYRKTVDGAKWAWNNKLKTAGILAGSTAVVAGAYYHKGILGVLKAGYDKFAPKATTAPKTSFATNALEFGKTAWNYATDNKIANHIFDNKKTYGIAGATTTAVLPIIVYIGYKGLQHLGHFANSLPESTSSLDDTYSQTKLPNGNVLF